MNTYTNASGEIITEHMTPQHPKPPDSDDSEQSSKGGGSPDFDRGATPEQNDDLLLDDMVFSREVTPEHEGGLLPDSPIISRQVSPDAKYGQLSGWSGREVSPEHAWEQPIPPFNTEVATEPTTYYTPQAADPDFNFIPLHEKRPAINEHDRSDDEADDWNTIVRCEEPDQQAYMKATAKDGTSIYRKPPYQTDLSDEVGTVGDPTSANLDGFRVCCNPTEGGPPPLAKVHLVFEVSPENRPHPRSWLGLPTTCLYEDASRAETLALRIEWDNEHGEIESEYLRYAHTPLLFSTTHEGQYDGLGLAIGILNHLENREIVQNKRPFVRDFGKARILHIIVDFFLQKITLQGYLDPPQKVADASIRAQNTIHQDLIAAGAENINLQLGTFRGTEERTRCDRCLVAHTIAAGNGESGRVEKMCSVIACGADCVLAVGTNRCTLCQQLGIDCTYTNDVLENPALLRALWHAPTSI